MTVQCVCWRSESISLPEFQRGFWLYFFRLFSLQHWSRTLIHRTSNIYGTLNRNRTFVIWTSSPKQLCYKDTCTPLKFWVFSLSQKKFFLVFKHIRKGWNAYHLFIISIPFFKEIQVQKSTFFKQFSCFIEILEKHQFKSNWIHKGW